MTEFIVKYWLQFAFGVVVAGMGTLYRKYQCMRAKHISSELALRALLRDKIIAMYNKYTEKGHIPIYELENLDDLFRQYKNLGGNGVITELVERLEDLPITK